MVCFTSDHGELLGDHHLFRKSLPYEGSARIPLVLQGPGVPRNRTSRVPAELRDVMPTLLDLAGLSIPEGVEGESLVPAIQGRTDGFKAYIHGEHGALGQAVHWITDGRTKYVWMSRSGYEQLFDLETDPCELHNAADDAPARTADWRQRLVRELTGREEGFVEDGTLVAGRPTQSILSHIRP